MFVANVGSTTNGRARDDEDMEAAAEKAALERGKRLSKRGFRPSWDASRKGGWFYH